MPSQVTVTGKTGPDRQVTTFVMTNVTNVDLEMGNQLLRVTHDKGISEFDMRIVTTLTDTISAGNHTIVVT